MSSDDGATSAASQHPPGIEANPAGGRALAVALLLALAGGAMTWCVLEYTRRCSRFEGYEVPGLGAPKLEASGVRARSIAATRCSTSAGSALLAGMLGLGRRRRRSLVRCWSPSPWGRWAVCRRPGRRPLSRAARRSGGQRQAPGGDARAAGLGRRPGLGNSTQTFRKIAAAAIAGALGGVLTAVLYPVAASLLLPGRHGFADSAGTGNRVLWLGISSGVLGLVVVGMTRE